MVTDNLDSTQLLRVLTLHQCFSFLRIFFFFFNPHSYWVVKANFTNLGDRNCRQDLDVY